MVHTLDVFFPNASILSSFSVFTPSATYFRMRAHSVFSCWRIAGASAGAQALRGSTRHIRYRSLPCDDPFAEKSSWDDPGDGMFAGWKDIPADQFAAAADSDAVKHSHFGPEWARFSVVGRMSVQAATQGGNAATLSAEERNTIQVQRNRALLEKNNFATYEEYLQQMPPASSASASPAGETTEDESYVPDVEAEPLELPKFITEPEKDIPTTATRGEPIERGHTNAAGGATEHFRHVVYAGLPQRFRCAFLPAEDPLSWETKDIVAFLTAFTPKEEDGSSVMDETMRATFFMAAATGSTLLNVVSPPRLFRVMRRWHVARQRVATALWNKKRLAVPVGAPTEEPSSAEIAEEAEAVSSAMEAALADLTPELIRETILLCFPYGFGRS